MLSKRLRGLWGTLSFRLVLLYTGISILSTGVAFVACYLLVASHLSSLIDEELGMELAEYIQIYADSGLDGLRGEILLESETEAPESTYFRLLSSAGEVLAATDVSSWGALEPPAGVLDNVMEGHGPVLGTLRLDFKPHDVRYLFGRAGDDVILEYGILLEDREMFLSFFGRVLIAVAIMMTVFSGLAGWLMSRRAMAGIEDVTRTAVRIRKGNLGQRVPLGGRGLEIETLAVTFNEMVDHVELLIKEMRELTDNIAHDLRSPITAIRGRSELALTEDRPRPELEAALASTVADCDELLQMINSMLDLAEADSGALKLNLEPLSVRELIDDVVEIFEIAAEEKGVRVVIDDVPDIMFGGDRQGMKRIVANLMDNALKYTPPRGAVTFRAEKIEGFVEISIADSGVGMDQRELPRIFGRFYRGDQSRSEPGIGLGLSLALAIARAHGGDIRVSSARGKGSVFTVSIPRS